MRTAKKKSFTFKIVTAGAGGVGKTTLLHRYVEGKFLVDTKMTIGVGFYLKKVNPENIEELPPNNTYQLQLWDFGGEYQFRPFLDSYARGAMGAILMFDLTRMVTLDNIDQWVKIVKKDNKEIPIIFVGAKLDLKEKISVKDDHVEEVMDNYNFIEYVKVSSKTGENVDYVFRRITEAVANHYSHNKKV